jgi:hypothetical protein
VSADELAYWRTLAEERGRALDELHARLRHALSILPDEQSTTLSAALDGRLGGWIHEPERMAPLAELLPADVASALDDLWSRVDADDGR